ncbi:MULTISPECIES: carotenoid biosynthesis protein [Persicobacter]|uniref:Carotenoid biosynthesis protein n=1 Tax=Persicobacter diffluens TaxID=981 RepID=A0AAN4VVI3_9BACT|nr:carotenoid biosynthesis protein [Persicobacter sp. CCB-QB2]GJM59580.1 hypothetical protein PEDI_01320 [Persicobacter diffluens]
MNLIKHLHFSNYKSAARPLLVLLATMHLAGVIGLTFEYSRPYFQLLTPLNLLFSNFVLFQFHHNKTRGFYLFAFSAFTVGLLMEMIGVNTGLIFGQYQYGQTLGLKIFHTPLTIGLNWFSLVYGSSYLFQQLKIHQLFKAALAAGTMVTLDIFIEPVAMALDFWNWENETIPFQNYLGWFIIAFLLSNLYYILVKKSKNPVSSIFFIIQGLFFIFLWALLR